MKLSGRQLLTGTKKKIFVAVNNFMDVLKKREHWMASYRVLIAVRNQEVVGYISALTLPILYFLRREVVDDKQARRDIKTVTKGFKVATLGEGILSQALLDLH